MANTYSRTESGTGIKYDEWVFDADGNGADARHEGGPFTVAVDVAGDIGGGSLRWQWKPVGGTKYANLGDAAVTDVTAGAYHGTVGPGDIRPVLSSSTSPDLTVFKI